TAVRFIVSVEPRFSGERTVGAMQALPYPRKGVTLYGCELDKNTIPQTLKDAQLQLMLDAYNGVDLFPDDTAEFAVKREKVGPIETGLAVGASATTGLQAQLTAAFAYLRPLFVGNGFGLCTVRI